jgi:hypothetical protein
MVVGEVVVGGELLVSLGVLIYSNGSDMSYFSIASLLRHHGPVK